MRRVVGKQENFFLNFIMINSSFQMNLERIILSSWVLQLENWVTKTQNPGRIILCGVDQGEFHCCLMTNRLSQHMET
jgi:hypothetical protein